MIWKEIIIILLLELVVDSRLYKLTKLILTMFESNFATISKRKMISYQKSMTQLIFPNLLVE